MSVNWAPPYCFLHGEKRIRQSDWSKKLPSHSVAAIFMPTLESKYDHTCNFVKVPTSRFVLYEI